MEKVLVILFDVSLTLPAGWPRCLLERATGAIQWLTVLLRDAFLLIVSVKRCGDQPNDCPSVAVVVE